MNDKDSRINTDQSSREHKTYPANIYTINNQSITGMDIFDAIRDGQTGDAVLFSKIFRNSLRFDHRAGEWYIYDQNQHHWRKDITRIALSSVGNTLATLYLHEANQQEKRSVEAKENKLLDVARLADQVRANLIVRVNDINSSIQYRQEILELAASGPNSLGISGEEWDRNPRLLACRNGVVNLIDGSLSNGKYNDFISLSTPIKWSSITHQPEKWSHFISTVTCGNMDNIRRIQRIIGAAISYSAQDPITVINIQDDYLKNTFFKTLKTVLGDLVSHLGFGKGPFAKICNPKGKRIIWEHLTPSNYKQVVSTLKSMILSITEGELSGKCHLPHFILTTRDDIPELIEELCDIGRNWNLVDFYDNNCMPDDGTLEEDLKAEASEILAWIVQGCVDLAIVRSQLSQSSSKKGQTTEH